MDYQEIVQYLEKNELAQKTAGAVFWVLSFIVLGMLTEWIWPRKEKAKKIYRNDKLWDDPS